MMLLNVNSVQHRGADRSADVLQDVESTTSAVTMPVVRRKILKGHRDDLSNVLDFSKVSGVSIQSICGELIRCSRHILPTGRQLPAHHAILQSLAVELVMQLEITLVAFQESDIYDIHRARCKGALHLRNQASCNAWVWVQAVCEEIYGARRGRLLAKLVALFEIRDYTCENAERWVVAVRMLSAVNSGFPSDIHGLVTVQMRADAREFTSVDVVTIESLGPRIPEGERRWPVNRRVDLRPFNEVY